MFLVKSYLNWDPGKLGTREFCSPRSSLTADLSANRILLLYNRTIYRCITENCHTQQNESISFMVAKRYTHIYCSIIIFMMELKIVAIGIVYELIIKKRLLHHLHSISSLLCSNICDYIVPINNEY